MAKKLDGFDFEDSILHRVREGTPVFDSRQKQIGEVDRVYLGEVSEDTLDSALGARLPVNDSNLAGGYNNADLAIGPTVSFTPGDTGTEANKTIRNRLLREGYIHIDTGMLSKDRLALPEQIETAQDDRVVLNVEADQLLTDDLVAD